MLNFLIPTAQMVYAIYEISCLERYASKWWFYFVLGEVYMENVRKSLRFCQLQMGKWPVFANFILVGKLSVLILPATNYWLEDGKHCLWETGSTYLFIFHFTGMFSITDFITVYCIDDLVKTIHLYTESFWITM